MRACCASALLIVVGTAGATATAASTWTEIGDSRFTVVTDAGENLARQLVADLEQLDAAIADSTGLHGAGGPLSGRPRIYLFRNEQEFSQFRKEPWVAGLTISPGNRTAPLVLLFAGPEMREHAIHEYVHVMVRRGDWKLPLWFEEGLAEFYGHSTARHESIEIGAIASQYLAALKNQTLKPSILEEPPEGVPRTRFYAAGWAMVHMLLMEPRYRPLTERLLSEGAWQGSLGQLLRDLQEYVTQPRWRTAAVAAPRPKTLNLKIRQINPLDADFMLASLLLDAGKPSAAKKQYYEKIAAAHPRDAAGAEALGFAALAEDKVPAALQSFRRAIELKSTRAAVWSELATLEQQRGAPWSEVKPLLERAAVLDPSDYRAAYLLGARESESGQWQPAVEHLASAAQAAPAQADVWHAYALALSSAGRREDALLAAKRALRVADSTAMERMASDLLASIERPPAPQGPRRNPEVVTSPAWSRAEPDAEVEGSFVEFVCGSNPPVLKLVTGEGRQLEFKVSDPSQVNILSSPQGDSSIELKCGAQDNRPIRVGYRRADGTVLVLKFPQVLDSKRF